MPNCKSCIHYDLCSYNAHQDALRSGENEKVIIFIGHKVACKFFKDSSRIIEPPCKVGDTVYAYNEYFGILPYLVGNFHIGYMGKEKDYLYWEAAAYATETDELLDDMEFDLDDIGKDVFLTREEAEKALAEKGV